MNQSLKTINHSLIIDNNESIIEINQSINNNESMIESIIDQSIIH